MKTNKALISCCSHRTTSGGGVGDKLLKHFQLVYLGIAFNVGKETLRFCGREGSELVPLFLELIKSWTRKGEEAEEMLIREEDWTMLAPSIPFLKMEMYAQYTPSVGSTNQCL